MATLDARLKRLGMSFSEYLKSEAWGRAKDRFGASDLPKVCLGCGSGEGLELIHRTHQRIGSELPNDLVPLCSDCLRAVETEISGGRLPKDMHAILRDIHGWTKSEMVKRFAPWRLPGQRNGCYVNPR